MATSDKESYDLKPKQGSYTGAGALEWKLLEMPQYCKGESAIVPVNIIKKQTGQKISEEDVLKVAQAVGCERASNLRWAAWLGRWRAPSRSRTMRPPPTVELSPLGLFELPPPTVEYSPLAWF